MQATVRRAANAATSAAASPTAVHGQAGDARRGSWRTSARGVNAAAGPIVARNTDGRAPATRSPVDPAAQRLEALRPAVRGEDVAGRRRRARRGGGASATLGNSLTPVSGARAGVDVAPARRRGRGDALGDEAASSGAAEPAGPLDLLEPRPRRLGQLVGEALDVPRAAGRVDDLGEVRLLDEHRLRVAGDAPAELGPAPSRRVVRAAR